MPRRPRYAPELIEAVCRDWGTRMTYKVLAAKYGFNRREMEYIIRVLGRDIVEKYEREVWEKYKQRFYVEPSGESDGPHP